jgi:solute carrier family 25 protein 16
MKLLYRQDGVRGLFRGNSATLLRIFPYAGIRFLAWEQIAATIMPTREYETYHRRFLCGSLAGCVSVFSTYPTDLIRVRLAFETKQGSKNTLRSICRKIYREQPIQAVPARPHVDTTSATRVAISTVEATAATLARAAPKKGLINFYRGFSATLWGIIPYSGTAFLTHDTIRDLFRHPSIAHKTTIPRTANSDPSKPAQLVWWAQIPAGGMAGVVSQTVSYPFEVIRRRMQVGGVVGDGHRLAMREVTKIIWKTNGFRGFFVGLSLGLVKNFPMSAVVFFSYSRIGHYLGL